jgi:hypothetical protein
VVKWTLRTVATGGKPTSTPPLKADAHREEPALHLLDDAERAGLDRSVKDDALASPPCGGPQGRVGAVTRPDGDRLAVR